MSDDKVSKEEFDKSSEERFKELDEAIENASSEEAKEALMEAKEKLQATKKLSDEAEEWIKKQDERTAKINEWKEETKYEYQKNMDIINDTIDSALRNSTDEWYEEFQGDDLIDKDKLVEIIENLEYDFMMEDCVELKTIVKYSTQALSGNREYCVWIDYKFRMDENMAMHKQWKFDVTDIIRDNKMGWLFD
jgi:hypothetical protein